MTEEEWLAATDPTPMLEFLRGKASDRKMRLCAVAFCRLIWEKITDAKSRRAVDAAEQFADGIVGKFALAEFSHGRYFEATSLSNTLMSAVGAAGWAVADQLTEEAVRFCSRHAADATFNSFNSSCERLDREYNIEQITHGVRASSYREQCDALQDIFGNPFRSVIPNPSWQTSTVVALARGIYDDRAWDRLPILADALQDAGCEDVQVLEHCRGPGPHVRGCWVVDLVLGKW